MFLNMVSAKRCHPVEGQCLNDAAFGVRCLRCKGNGTGLSLAMAVKNLGLRGAEVKCWEMSTYGSTLRQLKASLFTITVSEFLDGVASGCYVNGILVQDVQRTSFGDKSFDLITSNQVFEHVPDFPVAMRECHRILKDKGALLFSVPLYNSKATEKKAYLDAGKLVFCGRPEFHDSRLAGPGSSPVFWRFSVKDIVRLIDPALFESRILNVRLGAGLPESPIVYCVKR